MTRIDVHHHYLPACWLETVAKHPGHPPMPQDWSVEADLAAMDALGIQASVLSITSPGVYFGDVAETIALARAVNDEGAAIVRAHPHRYGLFASLPLPDVGAATAEAVRALDELGADGVIAVTSSDGVYLADESMRPLWEELNRRHAVMFIHPTVGPQVGGRSVMPDVDAWVEFPAETTRTAAQMTLRGFIREYPNVSVILSHAGGFLPYQVGRFEALTKIMPHLNLAEIQADLRSFYFDTSLSTLPATLDSLLAHAQPQHVLFGTDFPAAPLEIALDFERQLDTYFEAGHRAGLAGIQSSNALTLLPKLSQRIADRATQTGGQ